MVHKDWTLILDFDSTIIKLESLDLLAEVVFQNTLDFSLKTLEIKKLIDEGMTGKISFQESFKKKIRYFGIGTNSFK